jgi:hypothetical protein
VKRIAKVSATDLGRKFTYGFLGLAALASAGCLAQRQHGDSTTFYYAPWLGILLILGLLLFLAVGWFIKKSLRKFLSVTVIFLAIGGIFIPGWFLAHVTVRPDGFETRGLYWILPDHHSLRFEDLQEIQLIPRKGVGRDSWKTYVDWHCKMRNGSEVVINGSNLLVEAFPALAAGALKKSVPIRIRDDEAGGWLELRSSDLKE